MRVLVCGSRTWNDLDTLWAFLDGLLSDQPFNGITEVIEGGAQGADRLARRWARSRIVDCLTVEADWERYGKSAGPRRNLEMLDQCPDLVVAFVDKPLAESRGTNHTVTEARKRGIRTITVEQY